MRYLKALLTTALLTVSLVGLVQAAERDAVAPSQRLRDQCTGEGEFAATVAGYRDRGIAASAVTTALQTNAQTPLPGVSIATQEDELAYLTAMVERIYANPSLTPSQWGRVAYDACMDAGSPQ